MGGSGSGRWGGKPTIGRTRSYELSTRVFRDLLRLEHSGFRKTFRSDWDEVAVSGVVDNRESSPRLVISHSTRREPRETITYEISLVPTHPHLGGVRWWFLCPNRGHRVVKLYLPIGGRYFLSRKAYGLVHDTRQMSRIDRQSRRVTRIAGKLGEPNHDFFVPPEKPSRMRWQTYDRLVESWYAARNVYWQALDTR
jgi:hypothetical protein